MDKKIKIGIIGCGTISNVYIKNILEHYKNLELVACADMFVEKAQQTKEKYNLLVGCTVEELLSISEIEIVLNLTIPAAHYGVNMQILNAGKHVYCEKPLALTLEEAEKIYSIAAEKKLMAVSAPDTYLGAGAQTCRELIDKGSIGTPIGFTANMVCPGHELWHPAPGFYYKSGGGPMMDMGPYYITTLVTILGPIKKVSCFALKSREEREIQGKMTIVEVLTHYAGIMEFENGIVGNVNMSFDVWDSELPLLEVYGTEGAISIPDPNMYGGQVKLFNGKKLKEIVDAVTDPHPAKIITMVTKKAECQENVELLFPADPEPKCNMRGLGVSDMAQALIEGRESRLSASVSVHVVEALNAFEIASKTNKVYTMKTTCERPAPMKKNADLWQVI